MSPSPKHCQEDDVTTLKILIVGESGVGKSSLLIRFTDDYFNPDISATIGIDFKLKLINIDGRLLKLALWDLAGADRFRVLTPCYYNDAHGIIFVYDVSSRDTFKKLPDWLKECEKYSTKTNLVKLLVGNKIDKSAEREVERVEGLRFARQHSMFFIEASEKTKDGIELAVEELAEKILQTPGLVDEPKEKVNIGYPSQMVRSYGCSIL